VLFSRASKARRTWSIAAVGAAIVGIVATILVVSPASAAPTSVFDITKSVDKSLVLPGQSFTYTITVDCSPEDCPDARLVDVMPAEFDALTLLPAINVTGGPAAASWGGPNGRTLTVDFQTPLAGGGVGLESGSGYSVQVGFTVPSGLSPNWPYNDVPVSNTASVTSPNAPDAFASRDVTVRIPYSVSTATTADWTPATTQFKVGEASSLVLTTRNTSNALAESLTLVLPTTPSSTTVANNLFEAVNFASFGAVTFPQGADQIQVDAWVAGAWIVGTADTTAALPAGVDPTTVTGLRVIFTASTGTSLAANGTAGSIAVNLAQRGSLRTAGTSLVTGMTATAHVTGTVVVPGQTPQSSTASDTYVVGGLNSQVSATTSFTPTRIPAGTGSIVTITGTNTSNGPLSSLTIAEPSTGTMFTDLITFDGFRSSGWGWPAGATAGQVTWFVNTGTVPSPSSFTSGSGLPATPALDPGQRITGFAVEFTGSIASGQIARVPFRLAVAGEVVPPGNPIVVITDAPRIDGVNDAGAATPATPTATLEVLDPSVQVTLDKTVTPTVEIPAGGRQLVQLTTTTSSDSGYVSPSSITVVDVATADPLDYWRAFDAVEISSTPVSLGSTLRISATTDGTTWTQIAFIDATAAATTYRGAIPNSTTTVGLKFEFENPDGFAQGTVVRPSIIFVAQPTLRDTTTPTSSVGAPVSYTNVATVDAVGDITLVGAPAQVTASATDSAVGTIKTITGAGGLFDKQWQGSATVDSQSGQTRTARLLWGSEIIGYTGAVIQDPVTPTPIVDSVYQVFDLSIISAITPATDPLIAYDKITGVQLFNKNTLAWESVGSCTVITPCLGQLPQITLTTGQRASTIGVRVFVEEYAAGRQNDALAPPIGSGVASGPNGRPLDLVFQLRNTLRDASADPANPWITEDDVYNTGAAGVVENDGSLTLTSGGAPEVLEGSDTIIVVDNLPQVSLTKTAAAATLVIPNPDDVVAANYPATSFTIAATNTSTARAWFLRATDQMPCTVATVTACVHNTDITGNGYDVAPYDGAVYDPATNPFERLQLTKLTVTLTANSGIDLSKSVVTRWLYNNGSPIATTQLGGSTLYANNTSALNAASTWTDVIGVSVLYTGTDLSGGGTIASGARATMKFDVQLRQFLRSASTTLVSPTTVTNSAFTQIWDDVLDDNNRYDSKSASIALVAATLTVSTTKSFSQPSILEANRTSDVVATIASSSNGATASTREVVIEDTGTAFWDHFALRSLGAVTKPAGADRVRVDVQLGGSSTWTLGTASATAALPTGITLSEVTGIRFVFTKSAGGVFSNLAPASPWTASGLVTVRLRDALRATGTPVIWPTTVPAPVSATSTNDDYPVATATGTASILLDTGTFRLDVEKRPTVSTTPAGETIDFSLIVTNTGTGYIDNPIVIDQLPIDGALSAGGPLLFDPTSEITYARSTGGILPLTGQSISYDDAQRRITITWPAGSRLAPGEKYTVVIPLQVAPGLLEAYGEATNTMTIDSDRTLSACTNVSGNGRGAALSDANTRCTTTNGVSTISASAISSFKGVKGDVDAAGVSTSGAINVTNAATPCVADSQGFYRSPCAANTVIGGTDLWKLRFTNGGNIPAETASIVDVLPRVGDAYLRTGAARLSEFAPVFAGELAIVTDALSAGTTYTWQVTTTANPCPAFSSDPTCSTATWVDGASFSPANYGQIRAIRVIFDFSALPGAALPSIATLGVTYETINVPSMVGGDGRAPVSTATPNARAWNSFGVAASFGAGNASRAVEPIKAGVQLATGPLQVAKVITGASAAYAPTSYSLTVSCTVEGATVTLPASGALALAASNAVPYTARIDGIPVGSDCRLVEGASGASSVTYSPAAGTVPDAALVTIATAASTVATVPLGQRATVTNDYGTTSLRITKDVTTTTTAGTIGSFDFTLACTVNNGTTTLTVPLAAGDAAFTLADTEEHVVAGLPVTAQCALREADSDGATTIRVSRNGAAPVTVAQNQAATVLLGTEAEYTAAVTNHFDGGQLSVTKTVDGTGASYGTGSFTIRAVCTWHGQTLADETFDLIDGGVKVLDPIMPIGTSCAITEPAAGGATSTSMPASVSIPGPVGAQTTGMVNAVVTNTFTVGTLRVDKERIGAGAAVYGAGPFEAQVTCTWAPSGTTLTIPLPNDGVVELTSANGYAASVTGLIAGAECDVVETKSGAATATTIGAISAVSAGGTTVVDVTNEFATGSLIITKERVGAGASRFGEGPFEVSVSCEYEKDGSWVPVDLGADATQVLQADSDPDLNYRATVNGILAGAECTVVETDAALAVSSALTPVDGTVTIAATGEPQATVTVTNTFLIGQLEIEKTASESIVDGDDLFDYTFVVANVGPIDAGGVTVTDDIPAVLAVTAITAPTWTDCAVTGTDGDGYGGTLECVYDAVLAAGETADAFSITVRVLPEIAQDSIPNVAVVTSTTPTVDGDDDAAVVDVTWLAVAATPECVSDAPWLTYEIDAHNLAVGGRELTVTWADALGTVIHTDTVAIGSDGLITGRLLWPGAEVDSSGRGVGWPGWREALPGETPDWENLILDPTAYGYGLRSGAQVTFSINPETTVTATYPPATADCAEASRDYDADIWFTKVASTATVAAGERFEYTMTIGNAGAGAVKDVQLVDPVPSSLRILSVSPQPAVGGGPEWASCVVTDRDPNGFGGTVTCDLDRMLGYGQTTPEVILSVVVAATVPASTIINIGTATAVEGDTDLSTLSLDDRADVITAGSLALTGSPIGLLLQIVAVLWLIGLALLLMRMRVRARPTGRRAA
jgi:uncharacterized repeat protein (TIGR01451 family)